ncbi:MAG: hypothetical protein ACRD6X_04840 [Pyrinomonadaceae bacterium]
MIDRGRYNAPGEIDGLRTLALGIGGIALVAWFIGLYFDPEQALRGWLLGFVFWGGIGIGCIGVLMLQYLTGGAWGIVIRRVVEAGSRTLPLIFLLFVPLAVGVFNHSIYEWTHMSPNEHAIEARGIYLLPWAWVARSVIYFALFGVMVYLLNKWSAQQDATDNYEHSASLLARMSRFSGPTMVIYALVVTFAVVDWVMTLDPHFFSTIWGLLFVAGWALSCFCFSATMLAYLSDKVPMNDILGKRHFHDIGKLMLALVMVWAYFNFSQLLIIWSGNIPEETGWYITRMENGWIWIGYGLILLHFAFPFLILLQQDFKRKPKMLASIALFILLMRLVDMFFLIGPSPRINTHGAGQGAFIISWMDLAGVIAVGGIWLWYFFGQLKARALVPFMDPFFQRAIDHGKGH